MKNFNHNKHIREVWYGDSWLRYLIIESLEYQVVRVEVEIITDVLVNREDLRAHIGIRLHLLDHVSLYTCFIKCFLCNNNSETAHWICVRRLSSLVYRPLFEMLYNEGAQMWLLVCLLEWIVLASVFRPSDLK
jgi:hypothetical protein